MIKKTTPMYAIAMSVMLLVSCNNDSVSDDGNLKLKAAANFENTASQKFATSKEQNTIEITTFMINIKEIELEIDDYDEMMGSSGDMMGEIMRKFCTDIEFEGPFELDLLNGHMSIDIASANMPNDVYEEIEFDMDVCTNQNSELYGKSILIKGTINEMPFVFWHNTNEEFEIDYQNANNNLIINGGSMTTTINFNLSIIFGAATVIDFSLAKDTDGDGVIEINPNNDDDNKEIADLIKNLLEESADLLDN
ncbi:MAG: hypothetical protein COB60_09285 [Flavobacteriaceae bacterium]|nr:MAG: hypothetical protein COB60_09285 [Flavobacteriaceae bacterium]